MNTRIKQLRKALDLTQQEFADKLGIRQNTIAKYETGRGAPTRAVVSLICREFRVNEGWLRTGEGEMFRPEPKDAIDELIERYRLPREYRSLTEKFIALKPEQQEAVIEYMRQVAAALTADAAPAPSGYSSRAELEAEARAEAEEYYRRLLLEKSQADGSSPSSGGGTETA